MPTRGPVEPAAACLILAAVPVIPVEINTDVSDLLAGLKILIAIPDAVLVLELPGMTSELDMIFVKNRGLLLVAVGLALVPVLPLVVVADVLAVEPVVVVVGVVLLVPVVVVAVGLVALLLALLLFLPALVDELPDVPLLPAELEVVVMGEPLFGNCASICPRNSPFGKALLFTLI